MGVMSGGQSFCELFPIDSTHTTVTTTAAITLNNQVKSSISKDGLTLDTIHADPTTIAWLEENAATAGSADDAETVVNEKGVESSTGTSGSGEQQYLALVYGAKFNDGADKVEVVAMIGTLSEDAGDRDIERNKFHRPKFTLSRVTPLQDVTIPNAILQTASPALVVAPGTPEVLPEGQKYKTIFPAAGADA